MYGFADRLVIILGVDGVLDGLILALDKESLKIARLYTYIISLLYQKKIYVSLLPPPHDRELNIQVTSKYTKSNQVKEGGSFELGLLTAAGCSGKQAALKLVGSLNIKLYENSHNSRPFYSKGYI